MSSDTAVGMHNSLPPISSNQAQASVVAASTAHDDYSYEDKYEAFDDFYVDSRSGGSGRKRKAGKPSQQKGSNGVYSSKHVRAKSKERRSKR
jgi:hypothetical protein